MFACLHVPPLASESGRSKLRPCDRASADDDTRDSRSALAALAREFSPRVEVHGPGLVTLDARGLERLFGDAGSLGNELRRAAAERGLPARVALASTRTAAQLLAHARAGLTVVAPGDEPRWLAPLSLHLLEQLAANGLGPAVQSDVRHPKSGVNGEPQRDCAGPASLVALLKRWGLRTLGDFAALPSLDLSARLGRQGLAWQAVARGEELAPLVPDGPEERFEETLDLEWPIEGIEPLSFVFGRLFEALSAHLMERDRAAAVLHIQLQLVTREIDRRSLQLPAPMRDARVLRTLAILNLEAHPVAAGIDRVTVVADPVPGRVIQCSLLTRALPFPEQVSTLLARLGAVMGDDRVGMAAVVDSHRPGAFEMQPFSAQWHKPTPDSGPRTPDPGLRLASPELRSSEGGTPALALRRFRIPVPASVAVKDGRPVRVLTDRPGLRGGCIDASAGPWRTSGEWWRVSDARVQADSGPPRHLPRQSGEAARAGGAAAASLRVAWNRDEWDVNCTDGGVYRIYRDRERDRWFVDGIVD